jgi:3'(2'), 5'-bisphosphate nucleotidase
MSMILNDHELAAAVATSAATLLDLVRAQSLLAGKDLGRAGDATANALITAMLQAHRPDDGFLSEETAPDPARLHKDRVWIIDPLDGTREYGEREQARTDWAVHVALTERGVPTACAVGLPACAQVWSTARPVALPRAPTGRLKLLVSRTRAPDITRRVAARLDAELVPMGSAGAKVMAVLQGQAHAYLHAGGQYEWDSCAPVGVALAAGLHASRIDGRPCHYNQADPWMPDLLVCRPELASVLLDAVAQARQDEEDHHA